MPPSLLVVGNPDSVHVGAHFMEAAETLDLKAEILDARQAFDAPRWRQRFDWWARGHRPSRLEFFGDLVRRASLSGRYSHLLATGLAPIDESVLREVGGHGVCRMNFLTDDPWNPAHRAPWFLRALPSYDYVFSPRRANLAELERMSQGVVRYMPFGYSPLQHYPERGAGSDDAGVEADVMFAGGADRDRVRQIRPFIDAGLNVALYGGYWEQDARTREFARGFLGPSELRHAVKQAKVCLCLVRAANRDGHSMRSFELAAMGGCMLVENTPDHRELFGADGETVRFFDTMDAAVRIAKELVHAPQERARLSARAAGLITSQPNTYRDRLRAMLSSAAGRIDEHAPGTSRPCIAHGRTEGRVTNGQAGRA